MGMDWSDAGWIFQTWFRSEMDICGRPLSWYMTIAHPVFHCCIYSLLKVGVINIMLMYLAMHIVAIWNNIPKSLIVAIYSKLLLVASNRPGVRHVAMNNRTTAHAFLWIINHAIPWVACNIIHTKFEFQTCTYSWIGMLAIKHHESSSWNWLKTLMCDGYSSD